MQIYGVDFTSTPSRGKPLTVAQCELEGDRLVLRDLLRIQDFERFERALAEPGPWIAGFDFPFGLPRRLLRDLGWPESWEGTVSHAAAMTRREWEDLLALYRASRPAGDKEHLRATDRLTGSLSPMKTHGVPLAKMFQEGAPRLAAAPISVLPCRPLEPGRSGGRLAIEAYPGAVARGLIGRRSYKHEDPRRQGGARESARQDLVRRLLAGQLERYGVAVEMGRFFAQHLLADGRGDLLDAVLCAVQAAWVWQRRNQGFGFPPEADPVEGWIAEPAPG